MNMELSNKQGVGYLSAKAKFVFGVGNISSFIEVEGKSDSPKTGDDWKIRLALDAAHQVSEGHKVTLKEIRLSLIEIVSDHMQIY